MVSDILFSECEIDYIHQLCKNVFSTSKPSSLGCHTEKDNLLLRGLNAQICNTVEVKYGSVSMMLDSTMCYAYSIKRFNRNQSSIKIFRELIEVMKTPSLILDVRVKHFCSKQSYIVSNCPLVMSTLFYSLSVTHSDAMGWSWNSVPLPCFFFSEDDKEGHWEKFPLQKLTNACENTLNSLLCYVHHYIYTFKCNESIQ